MRPVANHIHAALLRAIAAEAGLDLLDRKKPFLIVEAIQSTDWASATFVGAQHCIAVRIEGEDVAVAEAVDRLVAGIADRDIPLLGQIVAEICVTPVSLDQRKVNVVSHALTVNVLTIED